jgi:hypothetical protein
MAMNKLSRILGPGLAGAVVLGVAVAAHAQPAPTLFDHYLCYKGAISKGEPKLPAPVRQVVGLSDQFEDRAYDVKDPIWHCNPVNKTYQGNTSPINYSAIHLRGYPILLSKQLPQSPDVKPNVTMVDEFGLIRLKVLKPESLNMRASKTEVATPPYVACAPSKPCVVGTCVPATGGFCLSDATFPAAPANDGSVDNFKCYAVAPNAFKFAKKTNALQLNDQFSVGGYPQWGFDVVKPTRICTPVNKALENPGAETHPSHLVCYQVANTKPPFPPKDKFPGRKVADANDNFIDQRMDVKTVNEICQPATKAICGDGVVDAPYEDCDSPKICVGGPTPGAPCTNASTCGTGGACKPNTLQCPAGVACGANCSCNLPPPPIAVDGSNGFCKGAGNPLACCTGSKTGTCDCPVYHEAGSFLDICENVFLSGCSAPAEVPAYPLESAGTTFRLCTTAADANGMRALTVDPSTWFSDALYTAPPAAPLPVTIGICAPSTMTGVIFTKANATTAPPNKFCTCGDPAKLRQPCPNDAFCDLTPGSGVCAGRDVDYTSTTDNSGTNFSFGDNTADPAGSALFAQDLEIHVYLGTDERCTGTGSDPSCVGCDGSTPAPAGRIGINASAGSPNLLLPLVTRFTTGNAENVITSGSQGGLLDGREVKGSGAPGLTATLVVAGGNAKVNIDTSPQPFGFVDVQFFAKQVFGPLSPF